MPKPTNKTQVDVSTESKSKPKSRPKKKSSTPQGNGSGRRSRYFEVLLAPASLQRTSSPRLLAQDSLSRSEQRK